jgi:hypothetical protein
MKKLLSAVALGVKRDGAVRFSYILEYLTAGTKPSHQLLLALVGTMIPLGEKKKQAKMEVTATLTALMLTAAPYQKPLGISIDEAMRMKPSRRSYVVWPDRVKSDIFTPHI